MDADLPQPARLGGVTEAEALDKRNHIFAVIAATVLGLGLVRAILLVAHTPALGYVRPSLLAGMLGLVLIAPVAGVTVHALRRRPVASIVHALLFFLIVADPVATLWLNSRGPEHYMVAGAYAIVAMIAVIALGEATRMHWIVLLAGFVTLGFGPPYLGLLPLALAAVASPVLMRRGRRETTWVFVFAVAATVILCFFRHPAPDPPSTSESLVASAPADRSGVSRVTLLARAIPRTLPMATSLAPAGLELASQGNVRRVADLPPHVMSFAGLVSRVPATASTFIGMLAILSLPFAVYWVAWSVRRRPLDESAIPSLYTTLVTITAYCAVAAVTDAAGPDAARVQSLGVLALLAAILVMPLVIVLLSADYWAGRVALAVAFGIFLLTCAWFGWSRTAPVAIGTVERFSVGNNRTLEVSGWALDPRGVKRVFATVGGGGETAATLGTERRDLQSAYPGYPDAVTGGFQMSIAPNAWRENQELRVFVENRTGAITEIDRIDVGIAP